MVSNRRRLIEDREKDIFEKRVKELEQLAAQYGLQARQSKNLELKRYSKFAEGFTRMLSDLYGLHGLQLEVTNELKDKVLSIELELEELKHNIKQASK
jgi:hypothetical protein